MKKHSIVRPPHLLKEALLAEPTKGIYLYEFGFTPEIILMYSSLKKIGNLIDLSDEILNIPYLREIDYINFDHKLMLYIKISNDNRLKRLLSIINKILKENNGIYLDILKLVKTVSMDIEKLIELLNIVLRHPDIKDNIYDLVKYNKSKICILGKLIHFDKIENLEDFNVDLLKVIYAAYRKNLNPTALYNKEYTKEQANQIMKGLVLGMDVSIYSDPKYPSEKMREIRKCLKIENGKIIADKDLATITAHELHHIRISYGEKYRKDQKQPTTVAKLTESINQSVKDALVVNYINNTKSTIDYGDILKSISIDGQSLKKIKFTDEQLFSCLSFLELEVYTRIENRDKTISIEKKVNFNQK